MTYRNKIENYADIIFYFKILFNNSKLLINRYVRKLNSGNKMLSYFITEKNRYRSGSKFGLTLGGDMSNFILFLLFLYIFSIL